MVGYCTLKKLSIDVGYSEDAIRGKMRDGIWILGREYVKAPDGRLMFDPDAVRRWIRGEAVSAA